MWDSIKARQHKFKSQVQQRSSKVLLLTARREGEGEGEGEGEAGRRDLDFLSGTLSIYALSTLGIDKRFLRGSAAV